MYNFFTETRAMFSFTKKNPINILNIGTRILLKDVMDQYLRSLGEIRTYYASKLNVAVESYRQHEMQIVFCEEYFSEGSALDFIEEIGGLNVCADRYFVLATESQSDELVSLAMEKNIDEILVKPFATEDVTKIIERYLEKKENLKKDWCADLSKAIQTNEQKRFQEATVLFRGLISKYPDNMPLLLEAAYFFYGQNKTEESFRILEKILSVNPSSARGLHLQGLCLKRTARFKEALDAFYQSNQVSPMNSHRYMDIVDTLLQMADERSAHALKADAENSALILARLKIMVIRREYGPAMQYMETRKNLLSESDRKEADVYLAVSRKMSGVK
jgi:response regulator of citrate/malate metabolism